MGDRHLTDGVSWGWKSWADDYPDLDPALGSRRVQYDAIEGTSEQELFHTYRFGLDRLTYSFAAPKGEYEVELYFAEPWYGRTGINATGWRLFDVAVNGKTALTNVDLYKEAGFEYAVKKVVKASSVDGRIVISFPRVAAGQAVISAIAIRKAGKVASYASDGTDLIDGKAAHSFLDNGDVVGATKQTWSHLPMDLLDSDWTTGAFRTRVDSDVYLPLRAEDVAPAGWGETDLKAQWIGEGEPACVSSAAALPPMKRSPFRRKVHCWCAVICRRPMRLASLPSPRPPDYLKPKRRNSTGVCSAPA